MKHLLFCASIIMLGIMIPGIYAENVPNWVKNTAGWWATDAISENEFVNAIEFLVKEGVINIKNTDDSQYPEWLMKNTSWEKARMITSTSFEKFTTSFIDKKATECQDCIETINEHGFRGESFSKNKSENTFRIFTLGGSTTFGHGVNDDETWPAQLQNMFSDVNSNMKIEVINAGIQAGDSRHEYQLVKQKLVNFDPDMIIMYDGWNDTDNNEINTTLENWDAVCKLGREQGFEVINIVQPILGTGHKILTSQEVDNLKRYTHKTMDEELTLKIKKLDNFAEEIFSKKNSSCSNTYDFRTIFDYALEPIYYDRGHTNIRGNEIIALHMLELLPDFIGFTYPDSVSKYNIIKKQNSENSGAYAPWTDLSNQDFRGLDLRNSIFYGANLSNADFRNADLSGADFRFSNISNANFKDSIIDNTRFHFAEFDEIDISKEPFTGMDLKFMNLSGAKLDNVNLSGIDLTYTNLSGHNLIEKDLSENIIDKTDLSNTKLPQREFLSDKMMNVVFDDSDFSENDFSKILFQSSSFNNVNFGNVDLSYANFNSVDLSNIKNKNLENVKMYGTAIVHSNAKAITFPKVIEYVNFNNSDFSFGDFSDSKIQSSFIHYAKLQNVNLENCDCKARIITLTINNQPELAELPIEQIREKISPFPTFTILDINLVGNDVEIGIIEFNNFVGADLTNANLTNANFYFNGFAFANLTNANLTNANLTNTYFNDSNLSGANLSGANLSCNGHSICT